MYYVRNYIVFGYIQIFKGEVLNFTNHYKKGLFKGICVYTSSSSPDILKIGDKINKLGIWDNDELYEENDPEFAIKYFAELLQIKDNETLIKNI